MYGEQTKEPGKASPKATLVDGVALKEGITIDEVIRKNTYNLDFRIMY